ncbi:hypothetical protein ACWD26_32690 [Streptomyces sp. NPDC002787]
MVMFADDTDNRPPSILITTLAGRAYTGEEDLFTAVRSVLDGMPRYIEKSGDEWWVPNPARGAHGHRRPPADGRHRPALPVRERSP